MLYNSDINDLANDLVERTRTHFHPIIEAHKERFQGWRSLWGQFEDAVSAWEKGRDPSFQGVAERVNEMAVAAAMLNNTDLQERAIEYEPTLGDTDRSLDFKLTKDGEQPPYVKVKTVRPVMQNEENAAKQHTNTLKHLPDKHALIMKDPAHYEAFTARSKFLQYALQIEAKLHDAPETENARFVLLFCSNGHSWKLDKLEDFADFYRNVNHRADDPFAMMEAHHIQQTGRALERTLEGFTYLERKYDEVEPRSFFYPVRGPRYFSAI